MKKRRKPSPSKTRRHRESVAAKRKARAFYKMRNGDTLPIPPDDEAEALFPWRGGGVVMLVIVAAAVIGWIVEKLF